MKVDDDFNMSSDSEISHDFEKDFTISKSI